jgi:hypothetical protein
MPSLWPCRRNSTSSRLRIIGNATLLLLMRRLSSEAQIRVRYCTEQSYSARLI